MTLVFGLCLGQAVCFMSIVNAPLLLCNIVTPSPVGRVMDCQEKTKFYDNLFCTKFTFPAGCFFTAVVEETCGPLTSSRYKGIFLDMI